MKNRVAHWDVLKILLALMVVAHHAAQAYGPTGGQWLVKDMQVLSWLKIFLYVNAGYLMGMYFFISGYFSAASLERKNSFEFLKERMRRLLLPVLVITLFVFVPMYGFLDGWQHGWFFYLIAYYVNKPPLAVGHLWFLLLLFAFSVLLSAVFKFIPPQITFSRRLMATLFILLATVTIRTREFWPIDTWKTMIIPLEPAHLPQYLTMFFLGYCYRQWKWELQIGGIEVSAYAVIAITGLALVEVWGAKPWMTVTIETFFGLSVVLWLPAMAQKIPLRFVNTVRLLSENNYGIYLFHLFCVLAFQYLLLPVAIPALAKWLLVTFLGFSGALLISFVLRKSYLIRKII